MNHPTGEKIINEVSYQNEVRRVVTQKSIKRVGRIINETRQVSENDLEARAILTPKAIKRVGRIINEINQVNNPTRIVTEKSVKHIPTITGVVNREINSGYWSKTSMVTKTATVEYLELNFTATYDDGVTDQIIY